MILIIDMNQKKDGLGKFEFIDPLVSLIKENYEVKHYSEKIDSDKYEKIILSGAPLKDNTYVEHINMFKWLKKCKIPVLGICAGMQIISLVFESSLCECQEIGMTKINTTKENSLFSSAFESYELHNYSIEPSEEIEILAQSEKCIQAIKIKDKEIYGVLFHPEIRNKEIICKFLCMT